MRRFVARGTKNMRAAAITARAITFAFTSEIATSRVSSDGSSIGMTT